MERFSVYHFRLIRVSSRGPLNTVNEKGSLNDRFLRRRFLRKTSLGKGLETPLLRKGIKNISA